MRILTVCGMGLGSSLILKMNIENIMEEENISGSVEVKDLSSIQGEIADYIFSSEEIGAKIEHPAEIIKVKNLTDKEEIREKLTAAYKKL